MIKPSQTILVFCAIVMIALVAVSLGVHLWTLFNIGPISRFILMPVFGGMVPAMAVIVFLSKPAVAAVDGSNVPRESLKHLWLRAPVGLCPVWFQRLLLVLAVYGIVQLVVMIFHANAVADSNGIVPGYVINRPM